MTKEQILHNLAKIEKDYNVKILFAAESGSRAWGFDSPDSDWDIRFIYVNNLEWYLTVDKRRDVIEVMGEDGFDAAGWDIRKALGLYKRTNLALFEWFHSPIIYIDNPALRTQLDILMPSIFNNKKALYHYYHIAINHDRRYLNKRGVELKRYLYFIRGLLACKYLLEHSSIPPVAFRELVAATVYDEDVLTEINHILTLKSQSSEHNCEIICQTLQNFGRELDEEIRTTIENYPDSENRERKDTELDKLLYTIILEKRY